MALRVKEYQVERIILLREQPTDGGSYSSPGSYQAGTILETEAWPNGARAWTGLLPDPNEPAVFGRPRNFTGRCYVGMSKRGLDWDFA